MADLQSQFRCPTSRDPRVVSQPAWSWTAARGAQRVDGAGDRLHAETRPGNSTARSRISARPFSVWRPWTGRCRQDVGLDRGEDDPEDLGDVWLVGHLGGFELGTSKQPPA